MATSVYSIRNTHQPKNLIELVGFFSGSSCTKFRKYLPATQSKLPIGIAVFCYRQNTYCRKPEDDSVGILGKCCRDQSNEQRVRNIRAGFEFRMRLRCQEIRMIFEFDHFHDSLIRR